MRFTINSLTLALLGLSSTSALAQTAYNDAWWANPNSNTNFVDHFNGNSLNRTKGLIENNSRVFRH